jgi:BlaI family penicillinase repressor
MLRHLEDKGLLVHEHAGPRYVYAPVASKGAVRMSALSKVVHTFFEGSISTAVAALLQSKPITRAEYERLSQVLAKALKEDK